MIPSTLRPMGGKKIMGGLSFGGRFFSRQKIFRPLAAQKFKKMWGQFEAHWGSPQGEVDLPTWSWCTHLAVWT